MLPWPSHRRRFQTNGALVFGPIQARLLHLVHQVWKDFGREKANWMVKVLGVDVGGVIINRTAHDGSDTSFLGDNYLKTTAVPEAFEALKKLNDSLEGRVWVVSKCGLKTELKTREWMKHHDFHEKTGIPIERFRFVRTRPDKAPVCRELGITHFVDDRYTVLRHMDSVGTWLLFGPDPVEREKGYHDIRVRFVDHWDEVIQAVMTD